jgi:hypothetical protein
MRQPVQQDAPDPVGYALISGWIAPRHASGRLRAARLEHPWVPPRAAVVGGFAAGGLRGAAGAWEPTASLAPSSSQAPDVPRFDGPPVPECVAAHSPFGCGGV